MKTRIKQYRAKFDMTQQELADRAEVTRMTIVYLEKGKYNPSLKLAHKISLILKTNIEELFIFDN